MIRRPFFGHRDYLCAYTSHLPRYAIMAAPPLVYSRCFRAGSDSNLVGITSRNYTATIESFVHVLKQSSAALVTSQSPHKFLNIRDTMITQLLRARTVQEIRNTEIGKCVRPIFIT